MGQSDLSKRLFEFAVRVIKFLRTLPNDLEYKVIKYQLIKASTSTGANYEESQGASSKADFHSKINISLREIKESNYWLRLLKAIINFKYDEKDCLILPTNQTSFPKSSVKYPPKQKTNPSPLSTLTFSLSTLTPHILLNKTHYSL